MGRGGAMGTPTVDYVCPRRHIHRCIYPCPCPYPSLPPPAGGKGGRGAGHGAPTAQRVSLSFPERRVAGMGRRSKWGVLCWKNCGCRSLGPGDWVVVVSCRMRIGQQAASLVTSENPSRSRRRDTAGKAGGGESTSSSRPALSPPETWAASVSGHPPDVTARPGS